MDHVHATSDAVVLILVGLIASGKSTFAQALEHHFPKFRRCNQDDLGNRRLVENLVRHSLHKGMSVCVDRTNFNPQQRSYWTKIAREFPGTSVWVIVFDTPYETCAARLRERTCHPTIKSAEEGLPILARFASDLQLPTPEEGYDHIISLTPADQPFPSYTREQVSAVLQRIRDSPPVADSSRLPRSRPIISGSPLNSRGSPSSHRGRIMRTFPSYASTSRGRATGFARGPYSGPLQRELTSGVGHTADSGCLPDGITQNLASGQSAGSNTVTLTGTRRNSGTVEDSTTIT